MKNKFFKKALAAITAAAAVVTLTACNTTQKENPSVNPNPDTETFTIGIVQPIEHDALTAAHEGFVKALADNGFVEGENVVFDYQNAQGDMSNLSTIADRFVSKEVDLILAIATDPAQAVANKTTEIPILATAVTSFEAAGLVEDITAPGGNISGTSDMNPVAAQIDLLVELVPEVKTVGFIYCSNEKNSILQIEMAKAQVEALGLAWTEVTVTNAGDVAQAMQSLVTKCEAVYIPTDNVVANAMATVHSVAMESKTPTICGESNQVREGGLATMGISYFDLGYQTGLMAIEVLGGKNVGEMPIQFAANSDEVAINAVVAEEIGFIIPEKYQSAIIN